MSINKALFSSEKQDWETPQDLFDKLNAIYDFELDVCATQENAKCKEFFTPEVDGLAQDWGKRTCWMNPPYSNVKEWMQKAYQESCKGAKVVCLVPSRTDTAWWHDYAMHGEITFIRGRLKFVGSKSSAPFPSALVVFKSPLELCSKCGRFPRIKGRRDGSVWDINIICKCGNHAWGVGEESKEFMINHTIKRWNDDNEAKNFVIQFGNDERKVD